MSTKHAFLAGAATAVLCLTMASLTAYAAPGFNVGGASAQEIVYTYSSVPVSCVDYPAASDSYVWNVKLTKINQDFIIDLKNNTSIVAFAGSCFSNAASTILIPWNAMSVQPKPVGPIFYADFVGAVPDFSTYNPTTDLPFFENMAFHLKFNQNAGGPRIQGLSGRTGSLQISGNANLCNMLPPSQQCFLLDLNYLDYMGNGQDVACMCATPSVQTIDLTDFSPLRTLSYSPQRLADSWLKHGRKEQVTVAACPRSSEATIGCGLWRLSISPPLLGSPPATRWPLVGQSSD